MPVRKRRVLVGSVSSVVWPAIMVLLPAGITFAAARVYAEAAPAPESCEAGVVSDCADASMGASCKTCAGGTCACYSGQCTDGGAGFSSVLVCRDVSKCDGIGDSRCQGKAAGDECATEPSPSKCTAASADCLPSDGGPVVSTSFLDCLPDTTTSGGASSSGDDRPFVPGPATVPGSSSSSSSGGEDDSGCSTSSSSSRLPLLGVPLAIGLLLALRKKRQPKNAPSARKRS